MRRGFGSGGREWEALNVEQEKDEKDAGVPAM